jgi:hypothetical protein
VTRLLLNRTPGDRVVQAVPKGLVVDGAAAAAAPGAASTASSV